jgi:hypothetical protein
MEFSRNCTIIGTAQQRSSRKSRAVDRGKFGHHQGYDLRFFRQGLRRGWQTANQSRPCRRFCAVGRSADLSRFGASCCGIAVSSDDSAITGAQAAIIGGCAATVSLRRLGQALRANCCAAAGIGQELVLVTARHAGIFCERDIGIAVSRGDATIAGAEAAAISRWAATDDLRCLRQGMCACFRTTADLGPTFTQN